MACDNIQQIADRQNNKILEIDEVIAGLGSLSGMEAVIGNLNGKKTELEQQQQSLLSMLQGLRKIMTDYKETELRIYDNGECSRVVGSRYHIGSQQVDQLAHIPQRARINTRS